MRKSHFVAALTLLAPIGVAAQAPPTNGAPPKRGEQVTVVGQQPKMICERFVPTGSIKSQKICRSQSDWELTSKDSLNELQRLKDRDQRYWQMRVTTQMMLGDTAN